MTPGRTGVPPRGAPPGRSVSQGSWACRAGGARMPPAHSDRVRLVAKARANMAVERRFKGRRAGNNPCGPGVLAPERPSTTRRHGIAPRGRPGGARRPRPDALPPAPGPSQSRASAPSPGRRSPAPSSAGGAEEGRGRSVRRRAAARRYDGAVRLPLPRRPLPASPAAASRPAASCTRGTARGGPNYRRETPAVPGRPGTRGRRGTPDLNPGVTRQMADSATPA